MAGLAECVPNVSVGREPAVLDLLERSVTDSGAALLDTHSDPDHNRSVLTLAGGLADIRRAVLALARVAVRAIDLRRHAGAHPRVGVLDVVPIVPLDGTDLSACVGEAHTLGQRIWEQFSVPVYLYGRAASQPSRERLEAVRRFGFERLSQMVGEGKMLPDIGGPTLHESAGACFVGVRDIMVALNVALGGCSVAVAKRVAGQVRERGGGLPGVKALGLYLESAGEVQVSMNVTKPCATPIGTVIDVVRERAVSMGATFLHAELVGLAPRAALGPDPAALGIRGYGPAMVLENRLAGLCGPPDSGRRCRPR
ncbi:MAG: glutamate formimidoyltransferase [Bryobacterales bacterium]|nr:glutamate formimidoyltransferase [Bryobacterales bacterium]